MRLGVGLIAIIMPLLVSILGKYGKVKTSDINCLHFIIHPIHHFIQYCPLLLLWSVTNKHFPLYPRVPCFFFPSGRSPPSHRLYLSRLRLFHLNPKNMCCKMVDSEWFRNTNVTCTAQIETQWPKQSRASRTMGLCPASTKYLAQDRPRGDQWNQQGNKRNSSSIKVFCGLAFVWTPSSKIQVQYEGFLQIGRGFLDNLWIKHQTLWKKTCLKPPPTWLHIYLNIFQPCPDIKIFPRLKGLHQWWPPEVQTCEAFEKECFRSRISSLKREFFG